MAETMIERVALAILRGKYPEAMPPDLKRWPSAKRDARAAIEAMGHPTRDMLTAFVDGETDTETVRTRYAAMIDAALNEQEGRG